MTTSIADDTDSKTNSLSTPADIVALQPGDFQAFQDALQACIKHEQLELYEQVKNNPVIDLNSKYRHFVTITEKTINITKAVGNDAMEVATHIATLCSTIKPHSSAPILINVQVEHQFSTERSIEMRWSEYAAIPADKADEVAANHAKNQATNFIWRCKYQTENTQTHTLLDSYRKRFPACFKI